MSAGGRDRVLVEGLPDDFFVALSADGLRGASSGRATPASHACPSGKTAPRVRTEIVGRGRLITPSELLRLNAADIAVSATIGAAERDGETLVAIAARGDANQLFTWIWGRGRSSGGTMVVSRFSV